MIAGNINRVYNHQYSKIQKFNSHVFIADYTEQTKVLIASLRRGIEFFSPTAPLDITSFKIQNTSNLEIAGVDFDSNSFTCANGNTLTQCESVFFPNKSSSTSWILFCELKYSSKTIYNESNLRKAIKQLYKTRYYYFQANIITQSNPSYLIASMPLQVEPFVNFAVPPPMLLKLKRKKNIILRFKNSVDIQNDALIIV